MVAIKSQQSVQLARERALRKVLRRYFADQANRLADAVQQFDRPTPAVVPLIFRADDEHERLMNAIERPILITYCAGAAEVLDIVNGSKAFGFNVFDLPFKLGSTVMQAIRSSVNALGKLAFWRKTQDKVAEELAEIIGAANDDGLSNASTARRIREELGKIKGTMTSDVVGTTETTAAYNAGSEIQREELLRDGYLIRKSWFSILDEVTRPVHRALNGVTVQGTGLFDVAGVLVPYPAHHSLPPEQRINCRCIAVTEYLDDFQGDEGDDY